MHQPNCSEYGRENADKTSNNPSDPETSPFPSPNNCATRNNAANKRNHAGFNGYSDSTPSIQSHGIPFHDLKIQSGPWGISIITYTLSIC